MRGTHDAGPNPASEDIQVSRFDTFLRRLLSIKRAGLLKVIDPAVSIQLDPFAQPEYAYLLGTRLWAVAFNVAAVAATNSFAGVFNPAGSGALVVVENMRIAGTATDETFAILGGSLFGLVNARDSRVIKGATSPMSAVLEIANAAAAVPAGPTGFAGTVGRIPNGSAMSPNIVPFPVVLSPGWGLQVRQTTVNLGLGMVAYGYERDLQNSEK
jgi:hypothetical protein